MRLFMWAIAAATLLVATTNAQANSESSAASAASASSAAAAAAASSAGINVASVPDCAKVCLSNSTQYATDCAQIDVKCLCNSQNYVSALSCCLATNCNSADQQTAIQFNVQECAAVNSTAPNFVGCSPFSLTSVVPGSQSTSSSSSSEPASKTTLGTDLATIPTAYTNTAILTATWSGGALFTGSCTVPMFAEVTVGSGNLVAIPQAGCALNRRNCCPFDPSQYEGLTKCPSDYFTTAGGCCPTGFSVYSAGLGAETPCYSKPTIALLPATTTSGAAVISDTVFSRRYTLVKAPPESFPKGAIAGIVVGVVVALLAPALIICCIRRMKKKSLAQTAENEKAAGTGQTFPPTEPTIDDPLANETPLHGPQELASPERGPNTPLSATRAPPFQSGLTQNPRVEAPASVPIEMPGSMYMHEHHPAYTGSQSDLTSRTPQTPRTPPRSAPGSPSATATTRSPVLSPSSPFRPGTESPGGGNFVITPLGSPRFREDVD